jgi:hypothetical protein
VKIPCFTAFLADTAFPKDVLGPVDLRAFLRFAACLLLVMISSPVLRYNTAPSVFSVSKSRPICKHSGRVHVRLNGVWPVRRKSEVKLQNEPNYLAENQADPISVKSDRGRLEIGAFIFRCYFRTSPSEVKAQQHRRLTGAKDRAILAAGSRWCDGHHKLDFWFSALRNSNRK